MTKTLRERAESWVAAYRKNPDYTSKWDAFELLSDLLTADEPVALQMECFECESKDHWTKDCPRRTAVKSSAT